MMELLHPLSLDSAMPLLHSTSRSSRIYLVKYYKRLKEKLLYQVYNPTKDLPWLSQLFDYGFIVQKQLYRGTRDGFNHQGFHSKVDGHGHTLLFVMTETGHRFGAYVSLAWEGHVGVPRTYKDAKSFIFSLTHKTVHKLKNKDELVINHSHKGASSIFSMGLWADICISVDCNNNKGSFCRLGSSYELPEHLMGKEDSKEAKEYLGGKERFKVVEMEVYKIMPM
ncbi:hypothetical protein FGO68_gene5824 [Halteria grandinella]|uniref:TLDc domain-containing protein n=1 Tax=Halteria grandinella TaxID=5974 RepID=A0A8J8NLE3_HALGN|nr:hypothetical protein FGO68_gene5824 [Halteria grandinella]